MRSLCCQCLGEQAGIKTHEQAWSSSGLAMSQCNRTGSLACSIVLDSCHPPDVPPVKTICTRRSAGRVLTGHTLFDIAFFLFEATSTNHVPEWSCISMSQLASLSVCHVLANRIRVGARVGPIFVLCLYRESLDYQRKQPRPTELKLPYQVYGSWRILQTVDRGSSTCCPRVHSWGAPLSTTTLIGIQRHHSDVALTIKYRNVSDHGPDQRETMLGRAYLMAVWKRITKANDDRNAART